nr:hypothetical protein CFP56_77074 [Quercus suber]
MLKSLILGDHPFLPKSIRILPIYAYQERRRTNSVETRERERNGEEATGTHGRVLQKEGRVEEAPDADESVPARHSWPRHRPRCLRRLPRRRAGLQKDPRSLSFSPPPSIYFRCFSLRWALGERKVGRSCISAFPFLVWCSIKSILIVMGLEACNFYFVS